MAGFVECLDIDEAVETVEKEEGEFPFLFIRIIIRMTRTSHHWGLSECQQEYAL